VEGFTQKRKQENPQQKQYGRNQEADEQQSTFGHDVFKGLTDNKPKQKSCEQENNDGATNEVRGYEHLEVVVGVGSLISIRWLNCGEGTLPTRWAA